MGIEIKAVSGMADLERWVAVHNEVRPDDPETLGAKALIRADELEREHVDLLAYLDGHPVGAATLSGEPMSDELGRGWIQVEVLPAFRGRGVGTALLGAVSEHARRAGRIGLVCDSRADDAYSRSFLERRGFVEHRRWAEFVLELDDAATNDADPPSGIELVCIADRPALLAGMYEVAVAAYKEHGGHLARQTESFVRWQVHELGSPATRLDLTPVAVAGETVVGFATLRTFPDAEAGEQRMVAVAPEWRGRGIAAALLAGQISDARQAGLRRLCSWVPDDGPAALYEKLGFEVHDRFVAFEGPLA